MFDTKSGYTILQGTNLSNKGWSIEGLNKLIASSSRAAGLYTKEAAVTAEAKGKAYGMVISSHLYTDNSAYKITKGESLMNIYSKIDSSSYPSGF